LIDKRRTILVVEDVDEIRSQMSEMLRKKGHQILSAANAEDAIKIAEHDRPHMILTDLDLPTFDALVQLVRAHKDLGTIPMAVIDINGPELKPTQDVKILSDFEQLDYFLQSCVN
jgi:chemosensory pili system protein ChpA (sensor histidine kinase/response regulator)